MAIGDEFREAAQEIISDFSTELGVSSFYSKTSTTYNTETGVNVPVFTTHNLLVVSDSLALEMAKTGQPASLDPQFLSTHRLILIAGLDLSVVPKPEDEVAPVGEGLRFRISSVDNDQYGALYTCYVDKKPVAAP